MLIFECVCVCMLCENLPGFKVAVKTWIFIDLGILSISKWNEFDNEALTQCSENSAEWID